MDFTFTFTFVQITSTLPGADALFAVTLLIFNSNHRVFTSVRVFVFFFSDCFLLVFARLLAFFVSTYRETERQNISIVFAGICLSFSPIMLSDRGRCTLRNADCEMRNFGVFCVIKIAENILVVELCTTVQSYRALDHRAQKPRIVVPGRKRW